MITVYYRKVFPLQKEDTFSRISPFAGMGAADIPLIEKLDKGRRQKLLRLKNEKVRARELTAGILLHDALCSRLRLSPADTPPFSIAYEEKGKPYLSGREDICFNISHSGDYVCVAVCDSFSERNADTSADTSAGALTDAPADTPVGSSAASPAGISVGVDIQKNPGKQSAASYGECLTADSRYTAGGKEEIYKNERKIAERFYTPSDRKRLASCGEEYGDLFYRMWSIKESYIKLTGEGMSQGLSGFEIDWNENRILDTKSQKPAAYFWEWQGIENYSLCVSAFTPQKVVWEKMEA